MPAPPKHHVPLLAPMPWADHVLDLRAEAPAPLPDTLTPVKTFTYAEDPGWSATIYTQVARGVTPRRVPRAEKSRQSVLVISTSADSVPGAPASRVAIAISAVITANRGKDTTLPGERDCPLARLLLLGKHSGMLLARTTAGDTSPFFHGWLTAVHEALVAGTWCSQTDGPEPAVGIPKAGRNPHTDSAWRNRIGWARLGAHNAAHARDLRSARINSPRTLMQWHEGGFDVEEAATWRFAGFAEPRKAQAYLRADMDPHRAHTWYQRATYIEPSTAAVLDRHGWGPGTAERLHADLTTVASISSPRSPYADTAMALLEAAAALTSAKPSLKPAHALECAVVGLDETDLDGLDAKTALACARAGLTGPEIATLHTQDRLDLDTLSTMAALRS